MGCSPTSVGTRTAVDPCLTASRPCSPSLLTLVPHTLSSAHTHRHTQARAHTHIHVRTHTCARTHTRARAHTRAVRSTAGHQKVLHTPMMASLYKAIPFLWTYTRARTAQPTVAPLPKETPPGPEPRLCRGWGVQTQTPFSKIQGARGHPRAPSAVLLHSRLPPVCGRSPGMTMRRTVSLPIPPPPGSRPNSHV